MCLGSWSDATAYRRRLRERRGQSESSNVSYTRNGTGQSPGGQEGAGRLSHLKQARPLPYLNWITTVVANTRAFDTGSQNPRYPQYERPCMESAHAEGGQSIYFSPWGARMMSDEWRRLPRWYADGHVGTLEIFSIMPRKRTFPLEDCGRFSRRLACCASPHLDNQFVGNHERQPSCPNPEGPCPCPSI